MAPMLVQAPVNIRLRQLQFARAAAAWAEKLADSGVGDINLNLVVAALEWGLQAAQEQFGTCL